MHAYLPASFAPRQHGQTATSAVLILIAATEFRIYGAIVIEARSRRSLRGSSFTRNKRGSRFPGKLEFRVFKPAASKLSPLPSFFLFACRVKRTYRDGGIRERAKATLKIYPGTKYYTKCQRGVETPRAGFPLTLHRCSMIFSPSLSVD